jgi:ParB family chromosome partitioning protein
MAMNASLNTGSEKMIAKMLYEADIPVTEENIQAVEQAADKALESVKLSDSSKSYLIKNELEPTIGNIYMASHSGEMRLLKLDEKVQQMLIDEMISAGHARALLAISDLNLHAQTAMKVFDEKLSVRETEKLVKKLTSEKPEKQLPEIKDTTAEETAYQDLEQRIRASLGTKVQIQRKKNHKGKIEIEYSSGEELERITDLLTSVH